MEAMHAIHMYTSQGVCPEHGFTHYASFASGICVPPLQECLSRCEKHIELVLTFSRCHVYDTLLHLTVSVGLIITGQGPTLSLCCYYQDQAASLTYAHVAPQHLTFQLPACNVMFDSACNVCTPMCPQ